MSKILVVTPPGPNADELAGKLADRGFDVQRASSGSEALPYALRDPPDVILMDSALSAMDRWHAVKRLNGEARTSRIPVLTLASDAHSPAGLQRVLDKLDQTLGPARVAATPVAASSRVAARRVDPDTPSGADGRVSTPILDAPPLPTSGPAPPLTPPTASVTSMPPGSVPPVKKATPTPAPQADASREKVSGIKITRRADPLDTGRILVVDDNDLNRDMLSRRLHRRGYSVEGAEDGEKALAAIASGNFDLVLLDWMMPGLSGLDVLKKLREQHTSVELPVIMATAKTEADDVVEALRAEANDYVTKPLNFDVVHARIRTQLSLVRAHRDLVASEQRYRALLENTGDMIVQYTLDGKIVYVSPASRTLLGIEPDVLQQKSWYDALHPIDRRELLSQQDKRALPTNFTYIARMPRADGHHIWVETSCRVMREPKTGAVELIQAACRDVTEHIERIRGDEPPLPLGGDIMAHPGWRSSTGEPAPPRGAAPADGPGEVQATEPASNAASAPPKPTPVVLVSAIDGLDAVVLSGMSNEEIGARVAAALRSLTERENG
ncbi:MAG: response regulator [Alphaproteobacteria bacterium]|nr:response regulator [Alphaproteobacteria bacterium]